MSLQNQSLPPNVLDSLKRGETIEAIRRLADTTGMELKQSMDVIDGYLHARTGPYADASTDPFPAQVVEALERGDKIAAIKMLRVYWGIGLKEAKDAVDARTRPTYASRPARPANTTAAYGPVRPQRSQMDRIWWLAVLVLVGYGIYYFLGYAQ